MAKDQNEKEYAMKKCIKCHETKDLIDFDLKKVSKDGRHSYCKSCKKQYRKTYYQKNKKKIDENALNYYHNNLEARRQWGREWYKKNQKKIQAKQTILQRNKRRNNLGHRELCYLRKKLWQIIGNIKREKETTEFLGCGMEAFKIHLESQFLTGMSWDNYGEWQIDHIKPCCSFDLKDIEQRKVCFHYTNLQPLWAIDNMKKGRKIL